LTTRQRQNSLQDINNISIERISGKEIGNCAMRGEERKEKSGGSNTALF